MKIKHILLIIILTIGFYPAQAKKTTKSFDKIVRETKNGVRYHKRGEYEKAYQYLSISAQWGIKEAQYLLGIMFLNGEYVDRSNDKGMAWLGVANEIKVKDWQATYNEIYQQLNTQQKTYIDNKVAQYIEYYGMESQRLDCDKQPIAGSRKLEINCTKVPGVATRLYEIER